LEGLGGQLSAVEVGQARELFQARLPEDYAAWMDFYDLAPEGKGFLLLERQETGPTPVTLVTNWRAGIPQQ
jgi:hypothetical protein